MIRPLSALCAAVFVAACSTAPPSPTCAALTQRIADFESDLAANDLAAILTYLPPPIIRSIARGVGETPERFLEIVAAEQDPAPLAAALETARFDMGFSCARLRQSPSGRDYAVMTSRFTPSGGTTQRQPVIALSDDEEWYLVRVDAPDKLQLVKVLYPDLSDINLPR